MFTAILALDLGVQIRALNSVIVGAQVCDLGCVQMHYLDTQIYNLALKSKIRVPKSQNLEPNL